VYDAPVVQRAVYRPVQDAVIAELRAAGPERVLDIGCGTGILTTRMADELRGSGVVGCDFSYGMLEQAASRRREVPWVQGDALRLPLRDESVDAVTSTESFHWFPDPDAALRELARVIRPDGTLLVAVVNPRTHSATRLLGTTSRVLGQPGQWSTRDIMAARVTAAGFDVRLQQRVARIGAVLIPTVLTVATRRP
jgi:ubiquinone/menaquinone biosynthesis C-methylase UbiE